MQVENVCMKALKPELILFKISTNFFPLLTGKLVLRAWAHCRFEVWKNQLLLFLYFMLSTQNGCLNLGNTFPQTLITPLIVKHNVTAQKVMSHGKEEVIKPFSSKLNKSIYCQPQERKVKSVFLKASESVL